MKPLTAMLLLLALAVAAQADGQRWQPASLAVWQQRLLVGNRNGQLVEVDLPGGAILRRSNAAQSIVDLACTPQGVYLLDPAGRQLMRFAAGRAHKVADVPAGAVRLAFDAPTRQLLVSARWRRELWLLRLDGQGGLGEQRAASLPFSPQELLALPGDETKTRWLVTDAFGGGLAVVDLSLGEVTHVHRVPGHNIRGLSLDDQGEHVLMAHQHLESKGLADYEELHWGRLMTNDVQTLPIDKLFDSARRTVSGYRESHGGIGGATGDPAALLSRRGVVAVAFSGVGEVLIESAGRQKRIPVGRGPTALAPWKDRLFVANRFDDTVSVIDVKKGAVVQSISLAVEPDKPAPLTLSPEQRGEQLFYDATLSHQGWISCHSCHTDGHANGMSVDTLGDGDYGAPKRIPSLLGTRETGPWGWSGGSPTLEAQIRKSVQTTMHGDRPLAEREVADLAAYLRSLRPPEPPDPTAKPRLADHGRQLFQSRCAACHAPPTYTTAELYDVGTRDEHGRTRFNPPSLRGVGHRASLLHDGSAGSLRELLEERRHPQDGAEAFTADELRDLLLFLRTL